MVQYCRPQNLDEAVHMLAASGDRGRVLIGGTDLLVRVRRQPLEPLVLVDLKTAEDLPEPLQFGDGTITVGPSAVMADIYGDAQISAWFPSLAAAARVVGSVAIRNRASLIGNICNASPACDTAPSLLVHGAEVTLLSSAGTRSIALQDFFEGPGRTGCKQGEVVIGVTLPVPPVGHRCAFERLTRRRGVDLATVNVAAGVSAAGNITLGLGAVAPTPLLTATSAPVDCHDRGAVEAVVNELVAVATPISDVRATSRYREAMVRVLATRAVLAAAHQPRPVEENDHV